MGVMWTREQKLVIDTRDRNILVSAAAGSGKTAVLVERIIAMITDSRRPVDIDRLLIVTFTRAAAGEMRERISLAIEKKLAENENDEHLQRQSTLLHHALITTIDSFCSYVVKNYFHLIDLDPSYRMAEEGELRMIQGDVVSAVLEEAYAAKDKEFQRFVECFSTGKTDEGIGDLIKKLYAFSVSYPYPEEWLLSCKEAYRIGGKEELEQAPWMALIKEDIRKCIQEAESLLEAALAVCRGEDGPYFYESALESDMVFVKKMLGTDSFEEWQQNLAGLSFARLPGKKDAQVSEEAKELVKNLRQQEKEILGDLREQYFSVPLETAAEYMRLAGGPVHVLIDLTLRFGELFAEKKKEKNLLDFQDLEHFALEILVDHTEGKDVRTPAAKELAERFAEVMIDEYQDSNFVQEKLLTAVSRMEDGRNNVFMVGDVKQSIYRFRLARPDLFMEKFHTYPVKESESAKAFRIDLHRNFRSRETVLSGVNFLFYQIMGESLGGVEYDDEAALYPGASFPEYEEKPDTDTELLLVETDEEEWKVMESGENVQELEARAAAGKLQEIVGNYPVLDKTTGSYRPARYGDCVILLRTLSGWSETFKKVLESQGIPANVTTKTGYFSAWEVVTVLNYLRILDNPRQDIPLTGALHNMPGGFSMEELARIKCAGKAAGKSSLYEALQSVGYEEESGENLPEELRRKVRAFLDTWRKLREKVSCTAMHELLWDIYRMTGIMDFVNANPAGEQQKANLLMLVEKARDYESTSYRGLFNFVRYIESLQKYQVDFGEADILSEGEDSVRIMSIHKSKGLEFPVVFVSGLGKQFNQQDARASLVMHPDLGVGADWVDAELRTRTPALLKKAVQRQIQLENLGEELRILYVALTRAKEKLILTGCTSKLEKKLTALEPLKKQEERRISYGKLVKGRCYLDWILPALARHRCMDAVYLAYDRKPYIFHPMHEDKSGFAVKILSPTQLALEEAESRSVQHLKREEIIGTDWQAVRNAGIRERLEETFSYVYPYAGMEAVPAKVTVSELKRRQMEEEESVSMYREEEIIPYVPAFIEKREDVLTGARRGTAYHRVFECLDFYRAEDLGEIKEQLAEMEREGKIDQDIHRTVRAWDILQFVKSPVGKRMGRAQQEGKLFREQPFVMGVAADRLNPDYDAGETVLVQGIIDAYFVEENKIILVDYKTDKVSAEDGSDLLGKYSMQLSYYAEALERLTGMKVSEKYIYSIYLQKQLNMVSY